MSNENQLIKRLRDHSLKGIIFDFDGTLLDIREPLEKSIEEVFAEKGITADMETTIQEIGALLETIQGNPLPKILLQSYDLFKYITALQNYTFLKKLRIAIKMFTRYLEYAKDASFFPGTKSLLENLNKNYDLYIVSHNQTKNVLEHLQKEDIEKYFKGIFGADMLPALKPSPDAFKPILELYKEAKSRDFLMLGDMPTDIEAGQEAGFWTIGLTSGVSNKSVLAECGPSLLIDSLNDFMELVGMSKTKISQPDTKKSLKINP